MKIDAKKAEKVALLIRDRDKKDLTLKQIDDILCTLEVLYAFYAVGDFMLWRAIQALRSEYEHELERRNANRTT